MSPQDPGNGPENAVEPRTGPAEAQLWQHRITKLRQLCAEHSFEEDGQWFNTSEIWASEVRDVLDGASDGCDPACDFVVGHTGNCSVPSGEREPVLSTQPGSDISVEAGFERETQPGSRLSID